MKYVVAGRNVTDGRPDVREVAVRRKRRRDGFEDYLGVGINDLVME